MPCANPTQIKNTKVSQTWSPLTSSAGEEGRRGNIPGNTQDPQEQHNIQQCPRSEGMRAGDQRWLGRTQRQGSRLSRSWPGPGRIEAAPGKGREARALGRGLGDVGVVGRPVRGPKSQAKGSDFSPGKRDATGRFLAQKEVVTFVL